MKKIITVLGLIITNLTFSQINEYDYYNVFLGQKIKGLYKGEGDKIPNGQGTFSYPNADYEIGIFENGKFIKGKIRYTIEGNIYEANYKFSEEVGGLWDDEPGKVIFANGNIYIGSLEWFYTLDKLTPDDCKEICNHFNSNTSGGIFKFKDGSEYRGSFNQRTGIPNGIGTIIHLNGQKIRSNFINGKFKDGEYTVFENGEWINYTESPKK